MQKREKKTVILLGGGREAEMPTKLALCTVRAVTVDPDQTCTLALVGTTLADGTLEVGKCDGTCRQAAIR